MTYKATPPRQVLLFFIGLMLLMYLPGMEIEWFIYYQLFFAGFCMIALFLQYELTILEERIEFRLFLFKFCVYKKQIKPEELRTIHFRRFGLIKMGAALKRKEGIEIRLVDFSPEGLDADLVRFSLRHRIPMTKAKDYKI